MNKQTICLMVLIGLIILWASVMTNLYFFQLAKYDILKAWCAVEVVK
jgi:hypothetical protein